jgi:hypothetical protein
MEATASTTGVCIIRVERDGLRPLITVRVNPDIATVAGEMSYRLADADRALCLVREFLTTMMRG